MTLHHQSPIPSLLKLLTITSRLLTSGIRVMQSPWGPIPLGYPPALAFVSHKEWRPKALGPARPFKEGWLLLLPSVSARWLWTSQFALRGF